MRPSTAATGDKGPAEQRLRVLSLWLVVAGLLTFFVTLYLYSVSVRVEIADMEAELKPLQATMTRVKTPEPKILALMSTLAPLESSIKEVNATKPTVAASHFVWPAIMSAIASHDPAQISLLSISQSGSEIILKGRAASDSAMTSYVRSLEASNLFARVVVQSVKTVATPVVLPTSTPPAQPTPIPTPPTPEPTPTPDLRDPYEVDDSQPRDIFLGQAQLRNFYPPSDVDQVKFLAKTGRLYRVSTSNLAPGVDTLLAVRLGSTIYANDDVSTGTLRSEILFRVDSSNDTVAVVEIRNRGSYGPEMTYRVIVEEVIPTPTPTPTATSTRAATATAPSQGAALSPWRRPAGLALILPASAHPAAAPEAIEFVIVLVLKAAPL